MQNHVTLQQVGFGCEKSKRCKAGISFFFLARGIGLSYLVRG